MELWITASGHCFSKIIPCLQRNFLHSKPVRVWSLASSEKWFLYFPLFWFWHCSHSGYSPLLTARLLFHLFSDSIFNLDSILVAQLNSFSAPVPAFLLFVTTPFWYVNWFSYIPMTVRTLLLSHILKLFFLVAICNITAQPSFAHHLSRVKSLPLWHQSFCIWPYI